MNEKKKLTAYAEERLGFYVYALRNPIDKRVFYVGKGVGSRILAHANGVIDAEDVPETMKIQTIKSIHEAGESVESFIIQHGLASDNHAFQTESAVYGVLKLLDEQPGQNLFSLTNIIQPPTFEDQGLMSVNDVLALYGEPADGMLIPHNSMFVKPTQTWRKTMTNQELWDYTRGWWRLSESRTRNTRYVFSVPNFVIRAVWEVQPGDWRNQGMGDHGWNDELDQPIKSSEKPLRGFDSCVDVSQSKFASLINKSVVHMYGEGQAKRPSVVYLDDQKIKDLARGSRAPLWNTNLG
jgi:hypothetical protein